MKIAALGTGIVGATIATKLVALGHDVMMGSRSATSPAAAEWAAAAGGAAGHGTFADAAAHGAVVVNCTSGAASLAALDAAGAGNLAGKLLIDVANPLDFSHGMPPSLTVCNTDSLAEQIQRAHPDARVVKALNTVNCAVMVDPSRIPGAHHLPICGDDEGAKREAAELIGTFGWPPDAFLDLGDLTAARATEMYVLLWVRLYGATGTADVSIRVVRG